MSGDRRRRRHRTASGSAPGASVEEGPVLRPPPTPTRIAVQSPSPSRYHLPEATATCLRPVHPPRPTHPPRRRRTPVADRASASFAPPRTWSVSRLTPATLAAAGALADSVVATSVPNQLVTTFATGYYWTSDLNVTERGTAGVAVTLSTANFSEGRESYVALRAAPLSADATTVACAPSYLAKGHVATCTIRTSDVYGNPQIGALPRHFLATYLSNPGAEGDCAGAVSASSESEDRFTLQFQSGVVTTGDAKAGVRVYVDFADAGFTISDCTGRTNAQVAALATRTAVPYRHRAVLYRAVPSRTVPYRPVPTNPIPTNPVPTSAIRSRPVPSRPNPQPVPQVAALVTSTAVPKRGEVDVRQTTLVWATAFAVMNYPVNLAVSLDAAASQAKRRHCYRCRACIR